MTSTTEMHGVDRLPAWWVWWLTTQQPSDEGASVTEAETALFADCRREGDGVKEDAVSASDTAYQGDHPPLWWRLGAPGLSAQTMRGMTVAAVILLNCYREGDAS